MPDGGTPAGYVRVTAGLCDAVTRAEHVEDARLMLADGSLYEAAARDLSAVRLQGRGVAYAIALPVTGAQAVVRHNRHGGKLARLTRDLFLPPTRAPHELAVALRLRVLGVPTPDVLMYGTSPAPFPFRRADVVTRRIEGGRDLATFLAFNAPNADREAAWEATRALVRTMNEAGGCTVIWHQRSTRNTGNGWLFPLSSTGGHSVSGGGDFSARRIASVMRISPDPAAEHNRFAVFTVSPITVNSRRRCDPMLPANASP